MFACADLHSTPNCIITDHFICLPTVDTIWFKYVHLFCYGFCWCFGWILALHLTTADQREATCDCVLKWFCRLFFRYCQTVVYLWRTCRKMSRSSLNNVVAQFNVKSANAYTKFVLSQIGSFSFIYQTLSRAVSNFSVAPLFLTRTNCSIWNERAILIEKCATHFQ